MPPAPLCQPPSGLSRGATHGATYLGSADRFPLLTMDHASAHTHSQAPTHAHSSAPVFLPQALCLLPQLLLLFPPSLLHGSSLAATRCFAGALRESWQLFIILFCRSSPLNSSPRSRGAPCYLFFSCVTATGGRVNWVTRLLVLRTLFCPPNKQPPPPPPPGTQCCSSPFLPLEEGPTDFLPSPFLPGFPCLVVSPPTQSPLSAKYSHASSIRIAFYRPIFHPPLPLPLLLETLEISTRLALSPALSGGSAVYSVGLAKHLARHTFRLSSSVSSFDRPNDIRQSMRRPPPQPLAS